MKLDLKYGIVYSPIREQLEQIGLKLDQNQCTTIEEVIIYVWALRGFKLITEKEMQKIWARLNRKLARMVKPL